MIYKRPVITLTSLLDLLFIIIFAYQIEIKSNADKYVQAEVSRIAPQNFPQGGTIASEQKELIAELRAENRSVKDELEFVREKADNATKNANEYKSQSEKYETQRDLLLEKIRDERKRIKDNVNNELQVEVYKQQVEELKNELQKKKRELVTVKQESERIKKQSKSKGVIPITAKDAEMTKMLVGAWEESCDKFGWKGTGHTTRYIMATINTKCIFKKDGKYYENAITKIVGDNVVQGGDLVVGDSPAPLEKGQSISSTSEGTWWIEDGYLYVRTTNDTGSWEILFINQQEYKMRNRSALAVGVRVK